MSHAEDCLRRRSWVVCERAHVPIRDAVDDRQVQDSQPVCVLSHGPVARMGGRGFEILGRRFAMAGRVIDNTRTPLCEFQWERATIWRANRGPRSSCRLFRRRDVPARTDRQPVRPETVTYVSGIICYLCARNGPRKVWCPQGELHKMYGGCALDCRGRPEPGNRAGGCAPARLADDFVKLFYGIAPGNSLLEERRGGFD